MDELKFESSKTHLKGFLVSVDKALQDIGSGIQTITNFEDALESLKALQETVLSCDVSDAESK